MKFLQRSFVAAALSMLAFSAMAADATGVWKGDVKLPTGQLLPFVARLKQEGTTVTGKMDGIGGAPDVVIADGKVNGNTITFNGTRLINNAPVKFSYTGTFVDNDTLDIKIVREDGTGAPLGTVTKRTKE